MNKCYFVLVVSTFVTTTNYAMDNSKSVTPISNEMLNANKFNQEYKKTKIALQLFELSKYKDVSGEISINKDTLESAIYYLKNADNSSETAETMLKQAAHQVTSFFETYYSIPKK